MKVFKNLLTLIKYLFFVLLFFLVFRVFILKSENLISGYDIYLESDKKEYMIGDSITLKVLFTSKKRSSILRIFNDKSNLQVVVNYEVNGTFSSYNKGTPIHFQHPSYYRWMLYKHSRYKLPKVESIFKEINGKIRGGENHIIFDFGLSGILRFTNHDKYVISVEIDELFPSLFYLIDFDYIIPQSNMIEITVTK